MKKKLLSISICVLMIMSLTFISCSKEKEEDTPEAQMLRRQMTQEGNDFEDPAYENEDDGAEIIVKSHDEQDYVGVWKATSERAEYLYGNVDLKINEDHTWSGNITEETFSGKWTYSSSGVMIRDNMKVINWNLYFASDGSLMFKNLDDPEISLVLKPVGK